MKIDQPTKKPNRKAKACALGGALAAILAWSLGEFTGVDMAAGAEAGFATIFAFALAYLAREEV